MELIFIGDHFYTESKTTMSCIYDTQGNRQDWGSVNCALRHGESVSIRPATDAEIGRFERRLREVKLEQKERQERWGREDRKAV